MKVVIVETLVPGAPSDASGVTLAARVRDAGHSAETLRLPFRWDADPLAQVLGVRLLEVPGVDRVVAIGFPAFAVRHPRLVAWRRDGDLPATASAAARAAYAAVLAGAEHVVAEPGDAGVDAVLRALA